MSFSLPSLLLWCRENPPPPPLGLLVSCVAKSVSFLSLLLRSPTAEGQILSLPMQACGLNPGLQHHLVVRRQNSWQEYLPS